MKGKTIKLSENNIKEHLYGLKVGRVVKLDIKSSNYNGKC